MTGDGKQGLSSRSTESQRDRALRGVAADVGLFDLRETSEGRCPQVRATRHHELGGHGRDLRVPQKSSRHARRPISGNPSRPMSSSRRSRPTRSSEELSRGRGSGEDFFIREDELVVDAEPPQTLSDELAFSQAGASSNPRAARGRAMSLASRGCGGRSGGALARSGARRRGSRRRGRGRGHDDD